MQHRIRIGPLMTNTPASSLKKRGGAMSREERQRRQATVVEDSRIPPLLEIPIDSFALGSSRRGSPAIVSLSEEFRACSLERQSSQWPELVGSHFRPYNDAIQDSRVTFAHFVETKFIPEHVEFKARAGRTHYQAILKHLITPEQVNRIFNPGRLANARLRSVPEWPYLDGVSLCSLGSEHVCRLITAANAAGYSGQTVKHIRNVFFAVISHAQRNGFFHGPNPASLVKLPKVAHKSQPKLTFEQTKTIIQLLPYPAKEIALIAIATGMSLVEICDLQWKHVNLSDSECFVDGESIPALTLVVRMPWSPDRLANSRSINRNRVVEIREPLFSTLTELNRRTPNLDGDTLVVTSNDGGPILPSRIQMNGLKQVKNALGLPWLTWQALRRARSSSLGELLPRLNTASHLRAPALSASALDSSKLSSVSAFATHPVKSNLHRPHSFCFGGRFRGNSNAVLHWTPAAEIREDVMRLYRPRNLL
jgi:integrase